MRHLTLLLAIAGLLSSCKSVPKAADPVAQSGEAAGSTATGSTAAASTAAAAGGLVPAADVATVNTYFKANKTNGMLPANASALSITPANSYFIVDLDGQRAYLYNEGKLIAASAIASGRKYYRTETGDYTVGQKDLNHRSTSYGSFVSKKGGTIMGDVKNGFDPTPAGARFQGALMKYFMRFHYNGGSTAMGFHRGILPGYPASHGCVRLPDKMASWFFSKVPPGTPIRVRGVKNGVRYGASQGRPKRSPKVHSSLKKKASSSKPAASKSADPGPESLTTPSPAESSAPAPEPEPAPAPAPPEPAAPAPSDPGSPGQ